MPVSGARGVFSANAVIEPISFIFILLLLAIVRNQRGITAEIDICYVSPFSEIRPIWRLGDIIRSACSDVVLAGAREYTRFDRADLGRLVARVIAPVTLPGRG